LPHYIAIFYAATFFRRFRISFSADATLLYFAIIGLRHIEDYCHAISCQDTLITPPLLRH
jgi:hypothetical protein